MKIVEVLTLILVILVFLYIMWITSVIHNMVQGLYYKLDDDA